MAPMWKRAPTQNCTGVVKAHLMTSARGKPSMLASSTGRSRGIQGKTMAVRNTGMVRHRLVLSSRRQAASSACLSSAPCHLDEQVKLSWLGFAVVGFDQHILSDWVNDEVQTKL